MTDLIYLLLDEDRGIYLPQAFAESAEGWKNIDPKDREALLAGPDHDFYWDAWNSVLDNATWTDPENHEVFYLYQDGNLYAVSELVHQAAVLKNFPGDLFLVPEQASKKARAILNAGPSILDEDGWPTEFEELTDLAHVVAHTTSRLDRMDAILDLLTLTKNPPKAADRFTVPEGDVLAASRVLDKDQLSCWFEAHKIAINFFDG